MGLFHSNGYSIIVLFFIFYGLQLFLAVAVGRPIPHTAHLRDCSTGSIGYSYEVRPTFRLLPWAISPTHCTTRTQLTIILIDSICYRPATVGSICHTVFARGFATTSVATHLTLNHGFPIIRLSQPGGCIDPTESLAERQRRSPRGWQHRDRESNPGPTNGKRRSQDWATEPL